MGVETYTVQYLADPSAFVAGARQVEAAVRGVDAAVTDGKKNLKGMFGPAARSASNAARKIGELNAAMTGVAPAAGAATSSMKGLGGAAAGASKKADVFAQLTNGWVTQAMLVAKAWDAAAGALNIYVKASEDAKRHQNQGAQTGLDMRGKAREYATLLHKPEVDDEVMKGLFAVAQAGGSVFDKALQFSSQFEGSVPAGEQKGHITAAQKEALKGEGLAFGNRIGLDEKAAGDLTGVIPQYVDMTKDEKGKPLTTEQGVDKALGQLNAMTAGLMDGRGEITTLARSEVGAAAGMLAAGHVTDHAEMGALAGVASTFSKSASGSGTAVKQMDRLVNESLDEAGEFNKSIGVADAKGDPAKLRVLKAHIDAQRSAAPDPSKFDPKGYLQSKGFHNDTELDSTLAFLENLGVLDQRIEKGRAAAKDGKSVRAANQRYRSSLVGQDRQGRAIKEAGEYEQTRRRQRLAAARNAAYGQLQAEGKIDTFGTNLADGFMDGTINRVKTNTGHEERIDERVW